MKRLILLIFIGFLVSACEVKLDENTVKLSYSSEELKGKNVQEIMSEFESIGFTNINVVILDDLIIGWLVKDGDIEQVTINNDDNFESNSAFNKDSEITISYHTFPQKNDNEIVKDENENEPIKEKEPLIEVEEVVIKVEDSIELQNFLAVLDPYDQIVKDFAIKYSGKIIEFDANIIVMDLHGKYKTRYDVLMLPGDYYPENAVGPYLKFEDVNMLNLNLTGDVPEYIGIGQNIRVRARVEKYNEIQGLFFLKPITTWIR